MGAKIVLTRLSGFDAYGYVFADQLDPKELVALGMDPELPFGAEMLEVEGDTETLEFWAFNCSRGTRIAIDEAYADEAIHEYILFHPAEEPDIYEKD